LYGLGDLVAHAADRVERVHGALEDDADLAPAVAPQGLFALRDEVDAEELDAASLDPPVRRQEPDERQRRRCLATARLAGEPQRLAVLEPKRHAVDRADPAALELEMGLQVGDFEERRRGIRQPRQRRLAPPPDGQRGGRRRRKGFGVARPGGALVVFGVVELAPDQRVARLGLQVARIDAQRRPPDFGLRMSSSALPTSVNARTTSRTHVAGGAVYHHAPRPGAPESWAALRISPHDGANGSPSPMNASVVSVNTAVANVSTDWATMRLMTLGRMWRRMMWPDPEPIIRVWLTNICSLSDRTWLRMIRAVVAQLVRPMTTTMTMSVARIPNSSASGPMTSSTTGARRIARPTMPSDRRM